MKVVAVLVVVICLGIVSREVYRRVDRSKILYRKIDVEVDQFRRQDLQDDYQKNVAIAILLVGVDLFFLIGLMFILL